MQFVAQAESQLEGLATQHADDEEGVHSEHILATARRKGLIEDIMYYWALAEAYLAEASLQNSFR